MESLRAASSVCSLPRKQPTSGLPEFGHFMDLAEVGNIRLRLEGWGGGEVKRSIVIGFPLPVPPPQAGEGTMWRQHEALQRHKPDEPTCAAHFQLTRVTRIFQKSVFTKTAPAGTGGTWLPTSLLPARGRRRAGVPNATFRCRQRSSAQFHCFRIVI